MRVLIVDDSAEVRSRLVEMLSDLDGVELIEPAADPLAATKSIAARVPDVVVLDIAYPSGSGIELLRAIRSQRLPCVVIVLTNYPSLPYRRACLEGGANYFLDKSTEFERLVEIVKELARPSGE